MTRDKSNRKIAEVLGFKFIASRDDEPPQWHHPLCSCVAMKPEDPCACHDGCYWQDGEDAPDFYNSEEANALVLEALVSSNCRVLIDRGGVTIYAPPPVSKRLMEQVILYDARGRKFDLELLRTAICEAYLAMLREKQ